MPVEEITNIGAKAERIKDLLEERNDDDQGSPDWLSDMNNEADYERHVHPQW